VQEICIEGINFPMHTVIWQELPEKQLEQLHRLYCLFYFFSLATTGDDIFNIYAFENIPLGVDIPKTYIINPVKSVLFLPHDLVKNQTEVQKAKDELEKIKPLFEEKWKKVEIMPGETVEFYDLLEIEGISGKSERWFNLREYSKDGHDHAKCFMY